MIEVVRVGLAATVQDGGRVGWAHLGVPRSGALDRPALQRANALVGNPADAAGLEITLRGLSLVARTPAIVAITGAPASVVLDGGPAAFAERLALVAGARLDIGPARAGIRTYLAIAGGIDVPPVLGSRSTDSLSGLGPAPLRKGDLLPTGWLEAPTPTAAEPSEPPEPPRDVILRLRFGPRDDWFTAAAREALLANPYQVTPLTDRVGARLAGPTLTRANAAELPSEPLVLGAVQVSADGQPIIFLADHPTTGGYPVIGVVGEADLALIAQLRPGGTVRFQVDESGDESGRGAVWT